MFVKITVRNYVKIPTIEFPKIQPNSLIIILTVYYIVLTVYSEQQKFSYSYANQEYVFIELYWEDWGGVLRIQ